MHFGHFGPFFFPLYFFSPLFVFKSFDLFVQFRHFIHTVQTHTALYCHLTVFFGGEGRGVNKGESKISVTGALNREILIARGTNFFKRNESSFYKRGHRNDDLKCQMIENNFA